MVILYRRMRRDGANAPTQKGDFTIILFSAKKTFALKKVIYSTPYLSMLISHEVFNCKIKAHGAGDTNQKAKNE